MSREELRNQNNVDLMIDNKFGDIKTQTAQPVVDYLKELNSQIITFERDGFVGSGYKIDNRTESLIEATPYPSVLAKMKSVGVNINTSEGHSVYGLSLQRALDGVGTEQMHKAVDSYFQKGHTDTSKFKEELAKTADVYVTNTEKVLHILDKDLSNGLIPSVKLGKFLIEAAGDQIDSFLSICPEQVKDMIETTRAYLYLTKDEQSPISNAINSQFDHYNEINDLVRNQYEVASDFYNKAYIEAGVDHPDVPAGTIYYYVDDETLPWSEKEKIGKKAKQLYLDSYKGTEYELATKNALSTIFTKNHPFIATAKDGLRLAYIEGYTKKEYEDYIIKLGRGEELKVDDYVKNPQQLDVNEHLHEYNRNHPDFKPLDVAYPVSPDLYQDVAWIVEQVKLVKDWKNDKFSVLNVKEGRHDATAAHKTAVGLKRSDKSNTRSVATIDR